VESFNRNFIESGVTRIVNWYLVASAYSIEPFPEQPAMMVAREPWGGKYYVRPVLWGYAHYGQFSRPGWLYLKGACGNLRGGGTYVTLKSPGEDFSIIAETKNAGKTQKISCILSGGLSAGRLCVWRSNEQAQFVRMSDITQVNGTFECTLEPHSIYSISTTSGQRKGSFEGVPPAKPFPFPYFETFEEYGDPDAWGSLPHYTADIAGVFEIAERPDGAGRCLRQVVTGGSQSWAPEWTPYTILGDPDWKDYEVSADVSVSQNGWAGVMGRVSGTGSGYGCKPDGYFLNLSGTGTCSLYVSKQNDKSEPGRLLASGKAPAGSSVAWHTLTLRFSGPAISGYVDGVLALSAADTTYSSGMAGLVTGSRNGTMNGALFDNLLINASGGARPEPAAFPRTLYPLYAPSLKK